jgi:cysteine desulfurase
MTKIDSPIYLDGFATMPLAPEARDAMFGAWSTPTNAGSPHVLGERAAMAVAAARAAVADLIGASASEITFTSGATESNNLVLTGIAQQATDKGDPRRRIVVSAVEHKAVLEPALSLQSRGFEVVVAPVDRHGVVDLAALATIVDRNTLLISVMAANNETGVLQPISEVVAIGRQQGALIHCDGAQAVGKIPLDVVALDIDYLSISSHKFYGPVGIGALYVSAAAPTPAPMHLGGGQQSGLRPGTEPVPLIVGFAAASRLAQTRLSADADHSHQLAQRLRAKLDEHQAGCQSTTNGVAVLPGSLSLAVDGVEADDLVAMIGRRVCLSTGSACSSGQVTPSHVLTAMGMDQSTAASVFRVYCGRYMTIEEVDAAAFMIAEACLRIRHRTGRHRQ